MDQNSYNNICGLCEKNIVVQKTGSTATETLLSITAVRWEEPEKVCSTGRQ